MSEDCLKNKIYRRKIYPPFRPDPLFCYGLNNSRPLCVQIRLVSDLLSFALILFSMLCDRKQCMWVYILSRKQEILSNWDSDDRIQKLWSIYPTPYHERASKGKKEWGKFHEIRQQRQLLIFQYIETEHLFGLGLVFLHKICPSFFAREISSICKTFKNHTCVSFALRKKSKKIGIPLNVHCQKIALLHTFSL